MMVEVRQPVGASDHIVQFYEHDCELAHTVGSYLADGVHASGVAVIIATDAHRQAFIGELEAAGVDVPAAVAKGQVVSLDAAAIVSQCMLGGRIDRDGFRRVIGGLVRDAAEAGPVRAYGEMVALLWDAGNVIAAIELEQLWNELGEELDFSLLCGYQRSSVSAPGDAEALKRVCHLHTAVLRRDELPAKSQSTEVSRQFRAEPEAPGAARRFVVAALREWGYCGTLLDDAQLIVSELATNAVIHAGSPFSIVARSEDARVRLTVYDGSRSQPRVRYCGHASTAGRGLQIVGLLAHRWGVDATDNGKAVWAELRR